MTLSALLATTTLLLTVICFGGGFYCKRRISLLQAEIRSSRELLQAEIRSSRQAEERRRQEKERRKRYYEENDISDPDNQINNIRNADLRPVRPVNKEAANVLYALDEWIDVNQPDWHVSFEVSMGAFIKTAHDLGKPRQKAAFSSYNSKRVDFPLIDRFGRPALVVEYHGSGHDLSDDASKRMDVKRLDLHRAGIPLLEIPVKTPKPRIAHMVTQALASGPSAQRQ